MSLRLDAGVVEWLKKDCEGYQTRANRMLREKMLEDLEELEGAEIVFDLGMGNRPSAVSDR